MAEPKEAGLPPELEPMAELDAEVARLSAALQTRVRDAQHAIQQAMVDFQVGLGAAQARLELRYDHDTKKMMQGLTNLYSK